QLQKEYGLFFTRFAQVLNIGRTGSVMFNELLKLFLTDDMNREVYKKVIQTYPSLNGLEKQLTGAFQHYKYYFPDKKVPAVYSFMSGFNASLIIDEGILGIGLDRYLGKDVPYYDQLEIPKYMQQKMIPGKIPSDCMYAWASVEFPFQPPGDSMTTDNAINRMIYEGKLLYFVKAMIPHEKDEMIMGYTPEQLKWCRMNERQMWAYLVEQKILFKTDYMTINKLTRDAPFTPFFPRESPGRAANWIGWQIVKDYMSLHKDISLSQLMISARYQEILNQSGYNPK
ncbi:MAG: hypothetical protein GWP10_06840, partial [Nitrospiraceae bacterium]|nr:hypothetical protein [Nitrospiraceae bacterium]